MSASGVAGADGARATPNRPGAGFWVGFVVGGAIVAYGVRGVITAPEGLRTLDLARWVVGADLLHDFVLVPVAIVVGAAVLAVTPVRLRPPVRFGLIATGVVLLVGWAPWRGYGAAIVPDNPTVQPLDYSAAILTAVGVVWAIAALWALVAQAVGPNAARYGAKRARTPSASRPKSASS